MSNTYQYTCTTEVRKKFSYYKQSTLSIHVIKCLVRAGGAVDHVEISPSSSLITMQYLVTVSHILHVLLRILEISIIWGILEPHE